MVQVLGVQFQRFTDLGEDFGAGVLQGPQFDYGLLVGVCPEAHDIAEFPGVHIGAALASVAGRQLEGFVEAGFLIAAGAGQAVLAQADSITDACG